MGKAGKINSKTKSNTKLIVFSQIETNHIEHRKQEPLILKDQTLLKSNTMALASNALVSPSFVCLKNEAQQAHSLLGSGLGYCSKTCPNV